MINGLIKSLILISEDSFPCPQVSDEAHDSCGPSGSDTSRVCGGVR